MGNPVSSSLSQKDVENTFGILLNSSLIFAIKQITFFAVTGFVALNLAQHQREFGAITTCCESQSLLVSVSRAALRTPTNSLTFCVKDFFSISISKVCCGVHQKVYLSSMHVKTEIVVPSNKTSKKNHTLAARNTTNMDTVSGQFCFSRQRHANTESIFYLENTFPPSVLNRIYRSQLQLQTAAIFPFPCSGFNYVS